MMGQTSSLMFGDVEKTQELAPITHHVPEEVIIHILSYVDPQTLVNLRLVNKLWKQFIDKEVWRLKLSRVNYNSLKSMDQKLKLPWYVYYLICAKDPFQKNLLRNHCGQDNLMYWKILSEGGNKWAVENPPQGSDPLPKADEFEDCECCFATSYYSCSKEQLIDLKEYGFNSIIMDTLQPEIEVSEWYAGRFDCGCVYDMRVELIDEQQKVVTHFDFHGSVQQWEGSEWMKVSHVFQNYGPGIRQIKYYHGGADTQFWNGHYGSKMSGACIRLKIPSTVFVNNNSIDSEREDDTEDEEAMNVTQ